MDQANIKKGEEYCFTAHDHGGNEYRARVYSTSPTGGVAKILEVLKVKNEATLFAIGDDRIFHYSNLSPFLST